MEIGNETANRKSARRSSRRAALLAADFRQAARMGRGEPFIVKLISPLAMLVVAATVTCCVLGFVLARQADDTFDNSQRLALRGAIEALQAASPANASAIDPKLVRILERASGLRGLRFQSDPPEASSAMQSLVDSRGRIVGWFSWEPERPAGAQ